MYHIGLCVVKLNNLDTYVNDDFPWCIYDGMDGCLREEFNRSEEGSSSG